MRLFEEKLPPVTRGKDIVIDNIRYLGTATFQPIMIEYNGNVPNPFLSSDTYKEDVSHYLGDSNPNRKSPNATFVAVKAIMDQHPSLNTPENINLPLTQFVRKLKLDHSDLEVKIGKRNQVKTAWKSILNLTGAEEEYVSFYAKNLPKGTGLYIWVIDNIPYYLGIASKSFNSRINNEYGKITAGNCVVDGQSQSCRSNAKYRDFFNAKKSVALYIYPMDVEKYVNDPKFMEFMERYNFKGTQPNTNVLQVFESMILDRYEFEGNIQHNKKMEEITRLQELAGIPKKSQILYRIDPSLEKLGIVDDSEIESGSDEWVELVSLIYQIPFDGDIENFLLQIDKKSQEIDFPISKLEMQLDVRGIEIV